MAVTTPSQVITTPNSVVPASMMPANNSVIGGMVTIDGVTFGAGNVVFRTTNRMEINPVGTPYGASGNVGWQPGSITYSL